MLNTNAHGTRLFPRFSCAMVSDLRSSKSGERQQRIDNCQEEGFIRRPPCCVHYAVESHKFLRNHGLSQGPIGSPRDPTEGQLNLSEAPYLRFVALKLCRVPVLDMPRRRQVRLLCFFSVLDPLQKEGNGVKKQYSKTNLRLYLCSSFLQILDILDMCQ